MLFALASSIQGVINNTKININFWRQHKYLASQLNVNSRWNSGKKKCNFLIDLKQSQATRMIQI